MTNDETPKPEIEKSNEWKMPEPVFRTSEGKAYEPSLDEDLHETEEQITEEQISAPRAKSSKMPFLLGGIFVVFFGATIVLAAIWFLFLRDIQPPKILTPEVEKITPTPAPTEALSTSPTPVESPTPTPAPNAGAPAPTL